MKTQTKKDVKKLTWLLAFLILIGLYNTQAILSPAVAEAPGERYTYLPQNPDKEFLTIPEQIMAIARERGFEDYQYLINLAWCESRFDTKATNLNKGHSLDAGIFQWNMFYHPEIGIDCALNIRCATIKTIEAINAGHKDWWVCDKYL